MQEEIKKISEEKEIKLEEREVNKYISIDDFAKVEIKLGTVINAKEVEGSDKLLRLTVDFGEEIEVESEGGITEKEKHFRNIFSGIKKYVNIEDIIGKQFPFVTNLQPRKMMGEYSEAMIMAASEKEIVDGVETESFALLNPTKILNNGVSLK